MITESLTIYKKIGAQPIFGTALRHIRVERLQPSSGVCQELPYLLQLTVPLQFQLLQEEIRYQTRESALEASEPEMLIEFAQDS